MFLFYCARQHDHFACPARHQRKPLLRCAHTGRHPKRPAKPSELATAHDAIHRHASLRKSAQSEFPWTHLPAMLRPTRARVRTAPRHSNASKHKCWRIVAQSVQIQCGNRITRRECTRRGHDQWVHLNRVILVTHAVQSATLGYLTTINQ
jgi:hypothetical protein